MVRQADSKTSKTPKKAPRQPERHAGVLLNGKPIKPALLEALRKPLGHEKRLVNTQRYLVNSGMNLIAHLVTRSEDTLRNGIRERMAFIGEKPDSDVVDTCIKEVKALCRYYRLPELGMQVENLDEMMDEAA